MPLFPSGNSFAILLSFNLSISVVLVAIYGHFIISSSVHSYIPKITHNIVTCILRSQSGLFLRFLNYLV